MLVAIIAAALAADTQPAVIHNAGNGDMGALSVLFPVPGEEGHWTAVRFDAHEHDLGVQSIDATFVRMPPYEGSDVNCVVDIPHDVMVFTAATDVPPANPEVLYRTTIPARFVTGYGRVPTHLDLPEEIFVPKGESLFVAFEMAGSYPDVNCLMLATDQEDHPVSREAEYWSFGTTAPFNWYGLDPIGILDKPVVSVNGLWYL